MVPIYQKEADPPSQAILQAEAMLLERDGVYFVGERFFGKQADAAMWRRLEAERLVDEEARREKLVCAFCFEKIGGQVAVVIAMRPVHPACAKEFDAWIAEHPSENDPEWLDVRDSAPVRFGDELTTWGELSLAERKEVSMTKAGRLVGSYPF